jgi:HD-GYP domain-containing protein (c-di-GMP phosphodiesterase class II)
VALAKTFRFYYTEIMPDRATVLEKMMSVEKDLTAIQDYDILLERLLTESRKLVNADAGSIYEYDEGCLIIRHAQNDTEQAKLEPGQKLPFSHFKFPPDENSVSGYCIKTHDTVNIPNAYEIDPAIHPFTFNRLLDIENGYKTISMLTVPLYALSSGKPLGVLQIINTKDENGNIVPFGKTKQEVIEHFALSAAATLERAYLSRNMVMRMIEMARFRDPTETSRHVTRVSHYSWEIYDRWAFVNHEEEKKAEKFRDTLKIASALHDVGKVGIPDIILKKKSKLDDFEYGIIKCHTCIGGSLFFEINSEVDRMSRDVALHHHECWDGSGYPGNIDYEGIRAADVLKSDYPYRIAATPGLKGDAIPLAARIVRLADVFDALCSARAYKAAWSIEDVLAEIKSQRGRQFDPALVDCFFQILPRIMSIKDAFTESGV